MSLPIRFHIDDEGQPRASWTTSGPIEVVLPEFLETDLGQDQAFARRLLEQGRRVRAGELPQYAATGNAFSLTVGPRETRIEPLYPSPKTGPASLLTRDFLALVERWHALVEAHDRIS